MTGDNTFDFAGIVHIIHAELDGSAPLNEIAHRAYEQIGDERYRTLTWAGFKHEVAQALTRRDAQGLPRASSINGVYVQRALWQPDHYKSAVADYCRRGEEMYGIARSLAAECEERHGIHIEIAETG